MNPAPRRTGLQEPGTQLLLDEDILETAHRARTFSELSGVPMRDLLLSPLTSLPLPIYNFGVNPDGTPTGRRRWAGTKPAAMWHPLMWLPRRLSARFRYKDLTGSEVYESDDLWAARVAMELHATGLYDSETGEWVDVLAMSGLDVTDELDLARIEDWLDGEEDEVLDEITLDGFVDNENPTWALISLLALEDVLWQASWAINANTLMDLVDSSALVSADLASAAGTIAASTGLSLLSRSEVAGGPDRLAEQFLTLHATLDSAPAGSPEAAAAVAELIEVLYSVREAYWPALQALHETSEGA